jgi:hypothetical protein
MGNDLKDDQRSVCIIGNEGKDYYRWDRPRSLGVATVKMESEMSSTLSVRSVIASAFRVLDQYTSERFGWLRSTCGEGACGVSTVSYPGLCKGNLTDLGRILHLSLAKGNPK